MCSFVCHTQVSCFSDTLASQQRIHFLIDACKNTLTINSSTSTCIIIHFSNMDLPVAADDFDSYVHRIGRTGRAGHTGLATTFYVPGDAPKVGNRKIAIKLIQQLKEAKQVVPSFLEMECANNGGGSSGTNKQRFGGNDVRSSSGRGRGSSDARNSGGRGGRGGRNNM